MKARRRSRHWTTTHDIEEQEIRVGGADWLIRGTLTIAWDFDPNADCDADGNRGRPLTSEADRAWTLIGAAQRSHDGEWEDAERTGADIPLAVQAAAADWADACQPPDDDPYEEDEGPDYDPMDAWERRERRYECRGY